MKLFLKRLLIILGITFALFVGAVAVIASLFEESVGRTLTTAINQQLRAELSIDDFELTVFRSFPDLSADFRGVKLEDSEGAPLLQAATVGFRFSLLSLLKPNLEVNSVVVSNGMLRIVIDKQGKGNYDIFESGPEADDGGSTVGIDLTLARLEHLSVSYTDARQGQQAEALIEEASFSGAFSSTAFTLKSAAQIQSNFIDLEGTRYLPGKSIAYDANLAVNLDEGIYELKQVLLKVEGNAFELDGVVESWASGTYYDLYATAEAGNLAGVLALLPAVYTAPLEGFASKGQFAFDAIVKGQYNAQQNPEVRVEFSLEEGRLSSDLLGQPVRDVSLQAVFTNGKYRNSSSSAFRLENFKGYFNRELLVMKGEVKNFDEPEVKVFLDGVLPLAPVHGLLGQPNITDGFGEVEFKQINIEGRYKDIINPSRIARVAASGELEFDDAGFIIGGEELILDRGVLVVEGNRLSMEGLRLEGAGCDITFEGSVFNFLPVLFADSLNAGGAQLEFDARLTGSQLDIDRLIGAVALTTAAEAEPPSVKDSLVQAHQARQAMFFSFLKGTFDSKIAAFNYDKIEGRNFSGQLTFAASEMKVLGEVNAFGGRVSLDGEVAFDTAPALTARLEGEAIEVNTLFEQTGSFGQEVLTHRHLEGQLDTKVVINAYWDDQGAFLMDRLRVLAGVGISDGALHGVEMLQDFSDFVHIGDLRKINFVDMQNFLEIKNSRLYLPVMFIRSNALNLTISGEHSFGNEIAYYLKVNAGQVLADRFRRHDPSLKPKPARKSGFFNLYYAMLGTLDDYNITAAKQRVKDDFERSEFRKREIQRALEQEFGIVELIEEPEIWKDIPEFEHDTYNPSAEQYLDFEVGGR